MKPTVEGSVKDIEWHLARKTAVKDRGTLRASFKRVPVRCRMVAMPVRPA